MKNCFLTVIQLFFLSSQIFPQIVIGKIVDENLNALSGIELKLYANPNVYTTTTLTDGGFSFILTEIKDEQLPSGYNVSNSFPNPFNPTTRIEITLPFSNNVKVEVYNLIGQRVGDIIEKVFNTGTHSIDIQLDGLPNGLYLVRIEIDNQYTVVSKIMLMYESQHLVTSIGFSRSYLSKDSYPSVQLDTKLDSLVASSVIIGSKTFTTLPNVEGNNLNLGNLIIERYCPDEPSVTYEGKVYNSVLIGSQCWLKENLNVGTMIQGSHYPSSPSEIEKYCYNNDTANCTLYGGLYLWNEAMQYVTTEGVKGICPEGWHIPTYSELQTLSSAVEENGNRLKREDQGLGIGKGTNETGFSALLAGYRHHPGGTGRLGNNGNFWSSTEAPPQSTAYSMELYDNISSITFYDYTKIHGYSVRCLKD